MQEQEFQAQAWNLAGRKVNKQALLAEIYAAAKQSIGVPVALDSAAITMFRLVLEQYLALNRLRERIAEQAATLLADNPDSRRLMTVPGIGPANALTILAEAGDLRRFRHHRQFLSFCGLNLSTRQSGKSRGQSHISKYGNARLRTALWMAAQSPVRMRENSFRRKFEHYVRGNPLDADLRRKAYTAVTAKLARVVFGLIKQQTDYRPFFGTSVPGGGALSRTRRWGSCDPVDNVWAFHLGWHCCFEFGKDHKPRLLDPVLTMVRAAPHMRWNHLALRFAAWLPGSVGAVAPINRLFSRCGGAGQGRRQPASFASEPLTVRRHAGYRAGALLACLARIRSPNCLLCEPPPTCIHSPPLLSDLVRYLNE